MLENSKCLFCNEIASYKGIGPLDQVYEVSCPNCGPFSVSSQLKDLFDFRDLDRHLISGLIREKNELGLKIDIIGFDNIEILKSDPLIPKTIMQKMDKVLLYFYRHTKKFGEIKVVKTEIPDYSTGYAVDYDEYLSMIKAQIEDGILTEENSIHSEYRFSISLFGMQRAEELLSTNIHSNYVFVAMGFRADLLEAHKMAIQPACEDCGYKAKLIIETEYNDDITDRIIAEIISSKFVITDFTYNNQGAYFEAGFAQGRGLPVIRTCRKDWFDETDETGVKKNHLHFDINHYNFILWESHEDLKQKLINRIKATIW